MTIPHRLEKLFKAVLILSIIVLSAIILYYGKPFLVPVAFAALFAMLLLPVTQWLERHRWNRVVATLCSVSILLVFAGGVFLFVGNQITKLSEDSGKIEQQVRSKYRQVQEYITNTMGIPKEKQEQMMKEQQSSAASKTSGMISGIIGGLTGILTDSIIVIVYIFLFIYFRAYLKRFVLRIAPDGEEENARRIMNRSQKVTQKYLAGMALMILSLWLMYGIGFSIAGVKNALFFAILCGLLEIVPFIGNLIGNGLAILMSLVQGGGTNVVIGILITYAVVQFLQSYILEPLVVGKEVNINPLFTILGLIGAEVLWGIPGMVIAIPALGVAKIICDNIESLKPYGQLIGEDHQGEKGLQKKVKDFTKKLAGSK
jgi:predicted PurR-regulated permease PerM